MRHGLPTITTREVTIVSEVRPPPPEPRTASRWPTLLAFIGGIVVLLFERMRWGFAPRWGPAAVPAVESSELATRLNRVSSHAVATATTVTYVAAAVVLVGTIFLVMRPHRHAVWVPIGITLLALVAVWVSTRGDLALLSIH